MEFKLKSNFTPSGDQPQAIEQLVEGIHKGINHQTLLGVTGSGKTFTIANVVERVQLPTLVISHNKTLAAQLFQEFRDFFPENAVEYFVSFYDYYQPEAYIPATDTYIEKDSDINDELDRLRLKATSSLMSRKDVIIVASVSCIYNIGSPQAYTAASISLKKGQQLNRNEFLRQLVRMQYHRNDLGLQRGNFRIRGDIIEVLPAYEDRPLRIETFDDTVETITQLHPISGKPIAQLEQITIFPARHYVTMRRTIEEAVLEIYKELENQLEYFRSQGRLLEAQRLQQRTLYDIEMLREVGYVSGIENYSRILDGRPPGSRPYSLIDFFNKPFLTVIDESHATIPQIRGMFNGDRARKETLVEHGFRLPSALDNRPLKFDEFEQLLDKVIYVSATPADYELHKSNGVIVEQIIRPTGLVDPLIEIKPATNQIDILVEELRCTVERKQRSLVTTLTKKMSEHLTEYLGTLGFNVQYLHSEIDTLDRPDILRDLRLGRFDILIGVNLLREGLDLPEVSLVAILDADKEGFLRSARSIIQIAGRAARNIEGRIILFADTQTASIQKAIEESERRRAKQLEYNRVHGIVPKSVERQIKSQISLEQPKPQLVSMIAETRENFLSENNKKAKKSCRNDTIKLLHQQMIEAAKKLQFEKAARLRDKIQQLQKNS